MSFSLATLARSFNLKLKIAESVHALLSNVLIIELTLPHLTLLLGEKKIKSGAEIIIEISSLVSPPPLSLWNFISFNLTNVGVVLTSCLRMKSERQSKN